MPDLLKNIIAIDPGINTGWASFKGDILQDVGTFKAYPCKCLESRRSASRSRCAGVKCFVARCEGIKNELTKYTKNHGRPGAVIIEIPTYMGGSIGRVVAVRGDLVKLTLITGYLIGLFSTYGTLIYPVSVYQWKGTLSKDICKERILNNKLLPHWTELNLENKSSHIIDAVGIGLWHLGEF